MKKSKTRLLFFLILSILLLAFIFSHSFQNGESSNAESEGVMNLILKVIDPNGVLDREIVHFLVRKGAHFTEFMLLGASVLSFLYAVFDMTKTLHRSLAFLIVLLAASVDEFIQSFTGRTSSLHDVFLDFLGASLGIVLAIVLNRVIRKKKKPLTET